MLGRYRYRVVVTRNDALGGCLVSLEREAEDMMDDMGIFRTEMGLEGPSSRGTIITLSNVMVDTGSEYTWAPASVLKRLGISAEREARFETADGRAITRPIGYAIVHAESIAAPDI